jgi:hypothetical protein
MAREDQAGVVVILSSEGRVGIQGLRVQRRVCRHANAY